MMVAETRKGKDRVQCWKKFKTFLFENARYHYSETSYLYTTKKQITSLQNFVLITTMDTTCK